MKGVKRANLFAAGGPFSGDWWIGPLMVILFLAVWEIAPRLGLVNEFFTSRPSLLLQAAIVDYGSRDFWSDALVSLVEFSELKRRIEAIEGKLSETASQG